KGGRRQENWADWGSVRGKPGIRVLDITVEAPLCGVAGHVVKAPWVRRLAANRVRLLVGVLLEPRIAAEFLRIVTEVIGGDRPGPAGVLPLSFRRQAVGLAGLLREPVAILHRRMVTDPDRGIALSSEAVRLVGIGRRRAGDR